MKKPELYERNDFLEVPECGVLALVVPRSATTHADPTKPTPDPASLKLMESARTVFESIRKAHFEGVFLLPTLTRDEIVKRIAKFLANSAMKRLVLLLAGRSNPKGDFVWGGDCSPDQPGFLRASDLQQIWRKVLEVQSEKRLLLILDFPDSVSWMDTIRQNGWMNVQAKDLGLRGPVDDHLRLQYDHLEGLGALLAWNSVPLYQLYSQRDEIGTRLFHPDYFFGNRTKLIQEFSLDLIFPSSFRPTYGCEGVLLTDHKRLLGKKYPGISSVHGFGQVVDREGKYLFQGLWDHGKFVRTVDPWADGEGKYLGEYRPDQSCVLELFHQRPGLNSGLCLDCSVKEGVEPRDRIPDVITQRWYPEVKEVDYVAGTPPESPPTFELLNGKAEFRVFSQGKLVRVEKGHFQNGILNGEGSRVSLAEEESLQATPLWAKAGRKPQIKDKTGEAEDEKQRLKEFRKFKGHFANGKWVHGSIRFGTHFQNATFRGKEENLGTGKGILAGKMVLRSGFVVEGRFGEDGSPVEVAAILDPDGHPTTNPTLYHDKLTGKATCLGENWSEVVVGEFKNGHMVGNGALFDAEGKFEGSFKRLRPDKGVVKKRGGTVFNFP